MQGFLVSHAIYAIVVFGVLEAMCIPIPSELTFLLGGAVASGGIPGTTQHPSLLLVIILGTVAELAGSFVAYGVGRAGGKPLVRRWGRYVLVTEHDVARAERFLVGRGAWALPVARMVPVIRAFASLVAGVVSVPVARFGLLNAAGTLIYAIALSSAGYALGDEWARFNKAFSNVSYVLVGLIVVAIIGYVVHRVRSMRKEARASQPGAASPAAPGRHRATRP